MLPRYRFELEFVDPETARFASSLGGRRFHDSHFSLKPLEDRIPMESPEALEALLLWLGHNQASGARKYEEIREKLIFLFSWRGCPLAEDLADETIDRTARAIMKPGFTFQGDPIAYFRGVARNVYLEWLRRNHRFREEPLSEAELLPAGEDDSDGYNPETMSACLEQCLAELPEEKKELLLGYYQDEKRAKINRRQNLAGTEGIGLNALRIQIFRLRSRVRNCVLICIGRSEI